MHKCWIPLFSHSGTEVAELISCVYLNPWMILSNRKDLIGVDERLSAFNVHLDSHEDLMEIIYDECKFFPDSEFLITLHGYMKIIPSEIIDLPNVKIYNVHPGDIVHYPELRGKDPQKRAIEAKHAKAGVVIHEVDSGIDTGRTISFREIDIDPLWGVNDLVKVLRDLSIDMWKDIIK